MSALHPDHINPEVLTTEKPGVYVEVAHIGDTEMTVALCNHNPENMPAVAEAFRGCAIVAVEAPNIDNDEMRHEKEEKATLLVSSAFDQEYARTVLSPARNEILGSLLYELASTDTRIVLIDINKDHPNYGVVADSIQKRDWYAGSISGVSPVRESKRRLIEAAVAVSDSDIVRDGVMAGQLVELADRFGATKIGALMGANHSGTVDAVAVADDPDKTQAARQRYVEERPSFDTIVHKVRHGEEIEDALMDKALLETYFIRAEISREESTELVKKMDKTMIERFLASVDQIAEGNEPRSERWLAIGDYIEAMVDVLREF